MNEDRAYSFLRLIRRSQRGRLKVYLGYAAGVGKTYQMLLEAQRLKRDGVDVVVGLIETHGRAETGALLAGLEAVPLRKTLYRGIEAEEMDLDAILARRPAVVLVDELAHTNLPGSRNAKRYQDVEALLSAGIHVISTLNVQHLESLYEIVERATSVKVRERIPDHVVAEADQLVNVDITSEDLRRRLEEGKVYTRERVETALNAFFRASNLEQLRELTLRELAAQLDSRRRESPLSEDAASSPDQVMVCLSSRGPNSAALLRYASRLAGRLNRNWYAVYVQTSRESPTLIDAETQRMIGNTLTLAQQLGATVFTYKGEDVAKTILQFAREYRVGHIVIGSPGKPVPLWRRLTCEISLLDRLIAESRGITVVVPDTKEISREETGASTGRKPGNHARTAGVPAGARAGHAVALSEMPVVVWDDRISKDAAMRQLLDRCCCGRADLAEKAWRALNEREKQGETFVGENVVIPHARLSGMPVPSMALGLGRMGISDLASGRTVPIMFLLLSPEAAPEKHLAMLGLLSKMARNDTWLKGVLQAKDVSDIRRTIQGWASGQDNSGGGL